MITSAYAQKMAQYNKWQNESLYACAGNLSAAERQEDRGAFFGSIEKTLIHIYWGDKLWLNRFGGTDLPRTAGGPADSINEFSDWVDLCRERPVLDEEIMKWSQGVTDDALAADFDWFSRSAAKEFTHPLWVLVAHFYNHQTHHRGQVHAMLTATGQIPADTDLILLPG